VNKPAASYSLADLATFVGGTPLGDAQTRVTALASASAAQSEHITFAVDTRRAKEAANCTAGIVIVREQDASVFSSRALLIHANPYFAYAKLAQHFTPRAVAKAGIHPSAVIEPSARVDASAEIGPLVYVAPNAVIGANVRIHAGVRIGAASEIGAGSELYPNVVVYHRCAIGQRAIVHAGVVIGADGFGFAPHAQGWEKIPQTGRVLIGDDVEIGANTTIDRGALDDTIIGNGVKLDNQIQIGHNCVIGEHTAVAGCAGIAGSSIIGKRCMIGGAAMIAGHLSIPDGTVISAGTMIESDIKAPGRYTGVFPTVEHSAWRKMAVRVRKLSKSQE
jgi:UDP-3-O-[3-hydroxymyristoyl] glucosamine N-acyltransferase